MNSPGGYLYLMYGDNAFDRDEAVKQIKDRMRALPAGEHNITELAAPADTVSDLLASADAVPFLADRRLVVARGFIARATGRGTGRRKAKGGDAASELVSIVEYLGRVPASTSILFVEEGGVDVSAVKDALPRGRAFVKEYVAPRKPEELQRWVRQRARAVGADLDEGAVRDLSTLGGEDLRRLDSELRKLEAFADGRTVSREDVRDLVVARDADQWALVNALESRRQERALQALRRLYSQGEKPEAILAAQLIPLYHRLVLGKEVSLLPARERNKLDPNTLGMKAYSLQLAAEKAGAFESAELESALEMLVDVDRAIKSGLAEPDVEVELLVVRLCSRLGARTA